MVRSLQPASEGGPRYQEVRQHILTRIRSGEWRPGDRIPSENELVNQFGVSRMTVNRALRELSLEGALVRVQGSGSFVADGNSRADVFDVSNIADEIRGRGHAYTARVVAVEQLEAPGDIAVRLNVAAGAPVFHTLLVHYENGIPVQLEDRHVNPFFAPEYLAHNFTEVTPNAVLSAAVPWSEAVHRIEAVLPQAWEARLLAIARADPCILVHRRTFAPLPGGGPDHGIVTVVRLLIPGGRAHIESRSRAAFTGAP